MNTHALIVLFVWAIIAAFTTVPLAHSFTKEIKGNYFYFFLALVAAGTIGFAISYISNLGSWFAISKFFETWFGPLLMLAIFSFVGAIPFLVNYTSALSFVGISLIIGFGAETLWSNHTPWQLITIIVSGICGFLFKRFLMKLSNNT